jgi:hypothetical protein
MMGARTSRLACSQHAIMQPNINEAPHFAAHEIGIGTGAADW